MIVENKIRLSEPKASLYPVPVTLVTCFDGPETNVLTVSWTGILCSVPPIIYVSVRPERYSYQLLERRGKFCLNIPPIELLEKVDYCGNRTGASVIKWKDCSFTMVGLEESYPKAIKECKHHLFCDIINQINFGTHTAFIAKVIHEYVDEDILRGDHVFDYSAIKPIAYCRKDYYSLGEKMGTYGFSNK